MCEKNYANLGPRYADSPPLPLGQLAFGVDN